MCKYCKYESDDRPCCEDCYLNRKSHMVFYMDLYRKSDFVCEGCVEFYYDRRRQEMLGIQEIVSIESTMLPISHFAINVNHMNRITLSLLKMEIIIYYVMDVLSFSRI